MTGLLTNPFNITDPSHDQYKYSNMENAFSTFKEIRDFSPLRKGQSVSLDETLSSHHFDFEGTDSLDGILWSSSDQLVAPKNFKGTLIISNSSLGDHAYGLHRHFHLKLSSNSEIQLNVLHDESIHAKSFLEFNFEIEEGAILNNKIMVIGGEFTRINIKAKLTGENAQFKQESIMLLGGTSHCDIHSLITHSKPNTFSSQTIKGIHNHKSHGIFTGKIHIEPNCNGVEGKQVHKTLLLAPTAQVHSEPQLEIYSDDVKCTHGSSTGQISDEELFYLETRGIDPNKAKALLAQAFVQKITQNIQDISFKIKCDKALESKLLLVTGPL